MKRFTTALLLVLPPAVVVLTLLQWHSVWATFACYHVGCCLLLPPLIELGLRRRSMAELARGAGLVVHGVRRGVIAGAALGAVMALSQLVALLAGREVFFADASIVPTLETWGVRPQLAPVLLAVMLLINGPAEEIYWRGYIHRRLRGVGSRRAAITLGSLAYASYHGVTLWLLLRSLPTAALFLAVIFASGCFWSWLRDRYGSLWPPLLSHAGATLGYMLVYWIGFAAD